MIDLLGKGEYMTALFWLVSIFIALSFHEFAHAYAAHKCGDNTARNFGRMTLNPISHIDPIGFLAMIIMGFGWAKPVPVNSRNFNKPKRDLAIVSFAGPLMNFSLGFIGVFFTQLFFALLLKTEIKEGIPFNFIFYLYEFFIYFTMINIGLGVFNLIPFPPMDGSKILMGVLPSKIAYKFVKIERYSGIFFLAVILSKYIPGLDIIFTPILWLREGICYMFAWIVELIPFLDFDLALWKMFY